jgi:hypothetical protein
LDEGALKEKLFHTNPMVIIGYIKALIDILANKRAQTLFEKYKLENRKDRTSYSGDYEEMLTQAEKNIRNLIKTQHQLKLSNDTLKAKLEEVEKSKVYLKRDYRYQEVRGMYNR